MRPVAHSCVAWRVLRAIEPLSHVLAWTSAEPLPGETCEITILELPRLSLRFSAQFDTFDMMETLLTRLQRVFCQ